MHTCELFKLEIAHQANKHARKIANFDQNILKGEGDGFSSNVGHTELLLQTNQFNIIIVFVTITKPKIKEVGLHVN